MRKMLSESLLLSFLEVGKPQLNRLLAQKRVVPALKKGRRVFYSEEDVLRLLPVSDYETFNILAMARAVFRLQAGAIAMAQKHFDYRPQFSQLFAEWRQCMDAGAQYRRIFFRRWGRIIDAFVRDEDFDFAVDCRTLLNLSEMRVVTAWFVAAACPLFKPSKEAMAQQRVFEAKLATQSDEYLHLVKGWKKYVEDFVGWRRVRSKCNDTDIPQDIRENVRREFEKRKAAFKLPPFRDDMAAYAGLSRMQVYRSLKCIWKKLAQRPDLREKITQRKIGEPDVQDGQRCPACNSIVTDEMDNCPNPKCGFNLYFAEFTAPRKTGGKKPVGTADPTNTYAEMDRRE